MGEPQILSRILAPNKSKLKRTQKEKDTETDPQKINDVLFSSRGAHFQGENGDWLQRPEFIRCSPATSWEEFVRYFWLSEEFWQIREIAKDQSLQFPFSPEGL